MMNAWLVNSFGDRAIAISHMNCRKGFVSTNLQMVLLKDT